MISFKKNLINNQRVFKQVAYFSIISLVFITTILFGYNRMSTLFRKEASELFPTHIWLEHALYEDQLDTEELTDFLQTIPKDNEYIYVYNQDTQSKALYYKDTTVLADDVEGFDGLLLFLLNKLLMHVDLGDVYNVFIKQNLDLKLLNESNSILINIGHEVNTDAFKGEIVTYRNVSKALLQEFKIVTIQCLLFISLSVLLIFINYKIMRNLYYTPLIKMREHFMKMSRFHLESFVYKKPVIPEIEKTIAAVNTTMFELQDGIKETKSFLDEMVHEIKNPAHNIKNELELIEDMLPEADEEMKQKLQSVINETENITSLLSSIKIIYDMYYLGGSPPDSWLNPIEKIKPIFEEYKKKYPNREFHFKYSINPNIHIWIDQGSIELMIRNLLDNAIKYSKEDSSIFIGIREYNQTKKIVIEVINSGSSIDYNNLGKIFGKYYRTNSAKAQTSGAGIGLWLINSIADIYNANVHVQSSTNTTGFAIAFQHYKIVEQERLVDEAISS
ncbi:HAMP domain-containing histidine kinase [Pradoshia sp. D12]|uniref:sensor histidine kinase n=1 Tax=Bacillus sp. D12 TaxID=336280 RepID=UPI00112B12F1|nr:HAMP domain-containing sensor histidine kinase [Bacillus sp. D12]QFK71391.1 HAMP domain-containing histidine kinase [Pradoshia sp. D12]TPF73186.1 HAMP domain-containing histidine kinase [Bacillus sp. D12]